MSIYAVLLASCHRVETRQILIRRRCFLVPNSLPTRKASLAHASTLFSFTISVTHIQVTRQCVLHPSLIALDNTSLLMLNRFTCVRCSVGDNLSIKQELNSRNDEAAPPSTTDRLANHAWSNTNTEVTDLGRCYLTTRRHV